MFYSYKLQKKEHSDVRHIPDPLRMRAIVPLQESKPLSPLELNKRIKVIISEKEGFSGRQVASEGFPVIEFSSYSEA